MKVFFILLFFVALLKPALAQVYPVQINISAQAVVSGSMAGFANGSLADIHLSAIMNDLQETDRKAYLVFQFTGGMINTKTNIVEIKAHDISLDFSSSAGMITLSSTEVGEYFKFDNLQNIYLNTYNSILPNATYQLQVTAYDWVTDRPISNTALYYFSVQHNNPPQITNVQSSGASGTANAGCGGTTSDGLSISWSAATAVGVNANIEYVIKFVKMLDPGMGKEAYFEMAARVVDDSGFDVVLTCGNAKSVNNIVLSAKGFEQDYTYVFKVQAIAVLGNDTIAAFDNDGYSDLCWFTYSGANADCPDITSFYADDVASNNAYLYWNYELPEGRHDVPEFIVMYKPADYDGGYSNEVELNSDNFHIEDLQPETSYKAKIISRCAFENSSNEWDSLVFKTTEYQSDLDCGDPEPQLALEFTDPLPQLFVGDMLYIDASSKDKTLLIPLKVTDAGTHNNDGSFTGVEAKISIGFDVLEAANIPPIILNSEKIWLDKNYTLVGGSFYSFNKNMWSQIANADAIDFGGSIRGQYMSGAEPPDYTLEGKIDTMSLNGTTLYVTVTENGQQQTKTVDISDKKAFVVADSQNNIWAVNTETGEVAYLGKKSEYSNALDNIDLSIIADAGMQVKFSNADDAKYALDPLSDAYTSSMFFSSSESSNKKYEYLPINDSTGNKYKVPWKFMASDNTDSVKVDIPGGIVRDSLHFITSTKLEVELDATNNNTLTLSSGDDGSFYEVYALYNDTDGQQKLCGKLKVFTETTKEMTVHLVPFYEDPNIDAETMQEELNDIYSRYGINWEVDIIEGLAGENTWDLDENGKMTLGDDFLSNYSGEQKMVNGLIMGLDGYNQTDCYVALFNTTATYENNNDDDYGEYLQGEMPIGKQFAYLYNVNGNIDARLLAHELGHGKFKLRHTFGSEASLSITQGTTTNLMDYGSSANNDSLVYAQWEAIHNPAIIGKVFQSDEDGASICIVDKPTEACSVEGEKRIVSGFETIIDPTNPISNQSPCQETFFYHVGDQSELMCCNDENEYEWVDPEFESGWYKASEYAEIIESITRSLAILNGDVFFVLNKEMTIADATYRVEEFFKDREISDTFYEAVELNYESVRKEAETDLSGSGAITPVYIEFDIILMFTGVGEVRELINLIKARRLINSTKLVASKIDNGIGIFIEEGGERLARYSDGAFKEVKLLGNVDEVIEQTGSLKYVDNWGNTSDVTFEFVKKGDNVGFRIINGPGNLTPKQIDDYVIWATENDEASKIMLGMWDNGGSNSYITKAGDEYTYFDFKDKWEEVYGIVNRSDDEIWKINKEFLDRQKAAGKEFFFSHDPYSPTNEQFFAREVNYLIDELGVKDFVKFEDLWKAVW